MIERLPIRAIAAGAITVLGITAVGGCSKLEAKYTNCISTYVDVDGASAVKDSLVHSLDQAMINDTGAGLPDGNAYSGAASTAAEIQDLLVAQYAMSGRVIDTEQYALAESNPFKNSLIRFCVGQTEAVDGSVKPASPGSIHIGNAACIMTFEYYTRAMHNENQRQEVADYCGGELALPESLR